MPSASPTATNAPRPQRVSWHRYVRHSDVGAYLALGWTMDGRGPLPGHHSAWSVLMDWTGSGEPPEPVK